MAADTPSQLVSMLPDLEPLFGAAFAVNLAYLNLKNFRYGEILIKKARELLEVDGGIGLNNERFQGCRWYVQISSLINQTDDNPPKLQLPLHFWACFYQFFFHTLIWKIRIDRLVACICTFFSAVYLILGVGHKIGFFQDSFRYFTQSEILNEFTYSVFFLFWPIFVVSIGAFCVWKGSKFIEYQLSGIRDETVTDAASEPPPLPDLDNPDL